MWKDPPNYRWPYRDAFGWCKLAERSCTEHDGCRACVLWEQAQGETVITEDDGEAD